MKSISWIEFLVTFLVFIIVFYILADSLRVIISNAKSQVSYVDDFQKFLVSSYYYIQTNELSNIKNFLISLNSYLVNQEYLEFLIVPKKIYYCFNCIYIYYNFSDRSINIVQNVSLNQYSRLDIKIFTNKTYYNITYNSEIRCIKYLDLEEETMRFCSIYFYGNSSVKIYPSRDYVFFHIIDSSLDFYDGQKYYKGIRQYALQYYLKKPFEFYINKENSVIRNIFMIN